MTEAFLSTIQAIHLLNMTKAFEGLKGLDEKGCS
jgi:hypothetical protein